MNNKLYGRLHGRCFIHGANHFKREGKRLHGRICEVTAECRYIRKHPKGKILGRRKARRLNWKLP